MHRDVNKDVKVCGVDLRSQRNLNPQLIYVDFFYECNKELLNVLSQNGIMNDAL